MIALLLCVSLCVSLADAGSSAPPRARYQYILANYLLAKGDVPGALAAADVALLHDARAAAPRILKARIARADGRSDDALILLEEAVSRAPDSVEAWTALAELRAARGDTYGAGVAQSKAAALGVRASATPPSGGGG